MNIAENFSIFKSLNFPIFLTLLGLISGMTSILFSISKEYTFACLFMLLAVFFDLIDGKIARFMKQTTHMGAELDSLCDMVSFGAAPVVLAFQTTKNIGEGWIFAVIIYIVFLMAGALRLARFNTENKKDYFRGIPIPTNGLAVPIFYFVGLTSWYPLVFLVLSAFMISSFKIPRFF